jgi:stringent starvation protein B
MMTPSRPYLLRAFYEWLVDNNLTPHIVVDALVDGVEVPQQFVKNGQIVLNLAPHAVGNLLMANDAVSFNARFGGTPMSVYIPIAAVMGIYARENGAGTVFADDIAPEAALSERDEPSGSTVASVDSAVESADEKSAERPKKPSGKPSLRIIK